ncbi:hypothetical protein B4U79_11787 [Dinothrombium tinctorium]|uniref:Uncharacterized protein n=1 Tax=Dinothrombium tinctorium TaxID=1965070 RepID=A0A443QXY7_9ACAR|nr:hypothetical protein B4U79_11787 [Dinothrombium tinctorium]
MMDLLYPPPQMKNFAPSLEDYLNLNFGFHW